MITNSFISTGVAFADTNVTNEVEAKSNAYGEITFVLLVKDRQGSKITSISAVNNQLIVKTDKTVAEEGFYFVFGTDSPVFDLNDANEYWYTSVDEVLNDGSGNYFGHEKISSYTSTKYYYVVASNGREFRVPMVRINATDLGKDIDNESSLTAHNVTVEYGSTWNDSVAKQVTGVKATDKSGNDVTNNVTISGNVDTKKTGNYNIIFNSPESGKSVTVVITVDLLKVAEIVGKVYPNIVFELYGDGEVEKFRRLASQLPNVKIKE
ncbi:hypothetical protein A5816_002906 [Enterococcus sp. 3G1_DIV0629]|uniref:immunoglobulin-like domain-containing protein n=1 Tax=Enterococcus sp. (strain 3G1_DIV0629) TaxID=1834176 RepID=UPI000A334AAE|nr:immunoglobulin-like domain-containing protein [Enterococcus sp. 3G1_DIV0629]OTO22234.1 hypothetical protein A5816_002906 [Enterococcus sp. 3G1_DIV0629]